MSEHRASIKQTVRQPNEPRELYCWQPRREESDCDRTLMRRLRASIRAARQRVVIDGGLHEQL